MEVIKTLPDIFEEFSEQRRNSFLHAYEIKSPEYYINDVTQQGGDPPDNRG